jgi:hypothetical protein
VISLPGGVPKGADISLRIFGNVAFAVAIAAAIGMSAPVAAMAPAAKTHATAKSHKQAKPAEPPQAQPDDPPTPKSDAATLVAQWIAASGDNGEFPYIIIDKQAARLFLFDADGQQIGDAPVLVGIAVGDDSSPGVGAKKLADIGTAEKTTPAGRFFARFGRAVGHEHVLWVDYHDSVALHAVVTTNRKERRLERLNSPEVDDNRITFGCINVPTKFYLKDVRPLFQKGGGVVYILPDVKPLEDVFPRVRLLPYLDVTARQESDAPKANSDASDAAG